MNITIKFRGKRIDNGEWAYGFFVEVSIRHDSYFGSWISTGNGHEKYKVIPETVGQFTGLLDKNGKEIYEGDIVEFTTNHNVYDGTGTKKKTFKAPVFWQDFRGSWSVQMNPHANNDLFRYVQNGGDAIVIGNVHDNPELLEDKP